MNKTLYIILFLCVFMLSSIGLLLAKKNTQAVLLFQVDGKVTVDKQLNSYFNSLQARLKREGVETVKIQDISSDCSNVKCALDISKKQSIPYIAVINVNTKAAVVSGDYKKYLEVDRLERIYSPRVTLYETKTGKQTNLFSNNNLNFDALKKTEPTVSYALLNKIKPTPTTATLNSNDHHLTVSALLTKPIKPYANMNGLGFGADIKYSYDYFKGTDIKVLGGLQVSYFADGADSISSFYFGSLNIGLGYTIHSGEKLQVTPVLGAGCVFNFADDFSYHPMINAGFEFAWNITKSSSIVLYPSLSVFFGEESPCRYFSLAVGNQFSF